jgi:hypothetical protein
MNKVELFTDADNERADFLAEKVGAIRALAKNVVRDVVEIGRHLSEAKVKFPERGDNAEFLAWAQDALGWSRTSVYRFMDVYALVQSSNFPTLGNFDLSALYLLAAPGTPAEVIEAVAERAEDGERITKAEAEQMVAKAMQETTDKLRDQILKLEQAEAQRIREAVEAVKAKFADDEKALKDDKKALKAELAQIRKNVFEDPKTLEKALCEMLGVKKLQPKHWKAVAEATGKQVVVNKKAYEPYTEEERAESDERIRQTSAITRALETLAAAPSPQALRPMVFEAQLGLHRQVASKVAAWLAEYAAILTEQ